MAGREVEVAFPSADVSPKESGSGSLSKGDSQIPDASSCTIVDVVRDAGPSVVQVLFRH